MNKKVSQIEFHFTMEEYNDYILRAAELIKEGYSMLSCYHDVPTLYCAREMDEPNIHVTFVKYKYD